MPWRWNRHVQEAVAAYLFLLPFALSLLIFFGYAFVRTVYFSFTDYNLFESPSWVGLQNYLAIIQDNRFLLALRNSIAFSVIVTLAQTALALVLAVVMNNRLRGITVFRTAYYLPSVTSSVVITLMFIWMFQRTGVMNYLITAAIVYRPVILTFLGLTLAAQVLQVLWERWRGRPAGWFEASLLFVSLVLAAAGTGALWVAGVTEPVAGVEPVRIVWLNTRRTIPEGGGWWSIPLPLAAIMMLNTWTTAPTFMLLYLAGLQDIPKELYEAAEVDGANRWQRFRYITVPMLRPVTFLVMTLGLIGTLQMFDQVAVIGSAAPLESVITLAYYIYHNAFPAGAMPRIGMASAAAVVLGLLPLIAVLIQRRVVERK
ncbi:MAG: sugar ABC transporter permease [Firmicutes bacterium]|nr:sugar ABC transporter permease [Bacillota bacterium]